MIEHLPVAAACFDTPLGVEGTVSGHWVLRMKLTSESRIQRIDGIEGRISPVLRCIEAAMVGSKMPSVSDRGRSNNLVMTRFRPYPAPRVHP